MGGEDDEDTKPLLEAAGNGVAREVFSTDEHGQVADGSIGGPRTRPPVLTSPTASREVGEKPVALLLWFFVRVLTKTPL